MPTLNVKYTLLTVYCEKFNIRVKLNKHLYFLLRLG